MVFTLFLHMGPLGFPVLRVFSNHLKLMKGRVAVSENAGTEVMQAFVDILVSALAGLWPWARYLASLPLESVICNAE